MERFVLDKKDFIIASIWIHMYSFPRELWDVEILARIGKVIGHFLKVLEVTKQQRYINYASIYVYMNISDPLPKLIHIYYQDEL